MTNGTVDDRPRGASSVRAILALALVYFVAARLALLLALPPGYATAVWPAAGIALAVVLARGNRVWPGVLLGSAASNLWTALACHEVPAAAVAVSLAIGVGAALQAVLAAQLVRRAVGYPTTLASEREGWRFVLFGSVMPCVVSPTIGCAALWCAGILGPGELAFSWATWWTGDALGSCTFGPIALMFCAEPRESWRRLRLPVGMPLAAALALAIGAYLLAGRTEMGNLRAQFERTASEVDHAVTELVQQLGDDAQDLAALFDSSQSVEASEFQTFAQRELRRRRGVQALEWIPRVTQQQLPAFVAAGAAAMPGFGVWERDAGGKRIPVALRDDYYPVTYIEPAAGNESAYGYDLGSEPIRRRAIERAIASGQVHITEPIRLVQDVANRLAVLAVFPVFEHGAAAAVGRVRGVVVIVGVIADLLQPRLDLVSHDDVDVALRDVEAHNELLFGSRGAGPGGDGDAEFSLVQSIPAGGRTWTAEITARRAFLAARRPMQAWAILAGGMLFTGLIGVVLLAAAGRTLQIAATVRQRTADLRAANELLTAKNAEHRLAVAALERSQLALEEAQARVGLGSWELDATAGTGIWSKSMFALVDRDPSAGVPPFAEFCERHLDRSERDRVLAALDEVQRTGGPVEFEHNLVASAGRRVDVRVIAAMTTDTLTGARRMVGSVLDVTERKRSDARMLADLREKEALLQEVHHRVKNNLQIISSLLNIQARGAAPEVAAMLHESQDRIHALAQIHEHLYRAREFASIDLKQHVSELCRRLVAAHRLGDDRVALVLDILPLTLSLEQAVPFSLLLNELVANACKHAFPGNRRGTITVSLSLDHDGEHRRLVVADDGIGLRASAGLGDGLGSRLIVALARQFGAAVEVDGTDGTRVTVTFVAANSDKALEPCSPPAS